MQQRGTGLPSDLALYLTTTLSPNIIAIDPIVGWHPYRAYVSRRRRRFAPHADRDDVDEWADHAGLNSGAMGYEQWDWRSISLNATVLRMQSLLLPQGQVAETRLTKNIRDLMDQPQTDLERLVYGVGDVHGMSDLLSHLLVEIESDSAASGKPALVVFLGDVVNRGAQTKQVLDRLVAGPTRLGDRWVVLRGNHEQMMLDALTTDSADIFQRWLKMGGMQTLASYGGGRKQATPQRARDLVDPAHLAFLADLPLIHIAGDYLFVHAGVEPGVPLHQQDAYKLLNIRRRFLKEPHRLPYTVIHGHTPTDGQPRLGPGRIGVDTGAYFSGILTAVAIEPNQPGRRFLRVPTSRDARWLK